MKLHISPKTRRPQRGFTLADLVALLGAVATLAGLMLPGLATAAKSGETAVCLNNLRQMARASQIYAADNGDRLPGAYHGGSVPGLNSSERPWTTGWLDWTSSPDNTNLLYLTSPRYACLSPYTGADPRLVKCPADRYLSPTQRQRGWTERVRSISVSVAVGEGNAESGPWEPAVFKHVRHISEIVYPAPAETWLFLDEHPDSINDPCFFPSYKTSWVDIPASYHNGAGGVVFVDGRAELHQWHGNTVLPVIFSFTAPAPAELQDIRWLRYRTPRVSEAYLPSGDYHGPPNVRRTPCSTPTPTWWSSAVSPPSWWRTTSTRRKTSSPAPSLRRRS